MSKSTSESEQSPIDNQKDAKVKPRGLLSDPNFVKIMVIATVMRFGYMVLNETLDINTDIDYYIYTEAAEKLLDPYSRNPFDRITYRYTPLLAFTMLPNLIWMPFGKVLFNLFDIFALVYMKKYLNTITWINQKQRDFCLKFWAYNIYMIYINGRGSCESISLFLLMGMLFYLRDYNLRNSQSSLIKAALFYGMLVHFRLYPILYGVSVVLYLNKGKIIPTLDTIKFFCYSAGLFTFLFIILVMMFGYIFVFEWALYHLVRKDPRHSQSVFWMRTMYRHEHGDALPVNLITLVFRLAAILIVSFRFKRNISYAIFMQTMIFTTLNTVYTAQYAIWEIQMLPIILTQNNLYKKKGYFFGILVAWFVLMEASIICGGLYEGQGKNTLYIMHWLNIAYLLYRVFVLKVVMGNSTAVAEF